MLRIQSAYEQSLDYDDDSLFELIINTNKGYMIVFYGEETDVRIETDMEPEDVKKVYTCDETLEYYMNNGVDTWMQWTLAEYLNYVEFEYCDGEPYLSDVYPEMRLYLKTVNLKNEMSGFYIKEDKTISYGRNHGYSCVKCESYEQAKYLRNKFQEMI